MLGAITNGDVVVLVLHVTLLIRGWNHRFHRLSDHFVGNPWLLFLSQHPKSRVLEGY